jgi:hypothetical protein
MKSIFASLTAVSSLFLAGLVVEASPIKSKPDVIIYEGQYPGWPWIAAGADGTLYCVFREGTAHDFSASGKALLCKSTDRGKSWSKVMVIVEEPDLDDRNVAIVELPNKELLVSYNTYTKARESLAMTIRSNDGGKTWAKPKSVGTANTRTRAAAVVLLDKTLVLPYYVAPSSGALAALSKDNGETSKTVRVPDTEGFIGDEWDIIEVEKDRLVGVLRNSHKKTDGFFWMSESRDGGATWSVPKRTNVQSQRYPSPAQLTYADRRMVSVSAVKRAGDDFLTWDLKRRLPCYLYNADETAIPDASYPVSVQVGQRERLIVDYEIRKDSKRIAGYFVTMPAEW